MTMKTKQLLDAALSQILMPIASACGSRAPTRKEPFLLRETCDGTYALAGFFVPRSAKPFPEFGLDLCTHLAVNDMPRFEPSRQRTLFLDNIDGGRFAARLLQGNAAVMANIRARLEGERSVLLSDPNVCGILETPQKDGMHIAEIGDLRSVWSPLCAEAIPLAMERMAAAGRTGRV